MGKADRIACRRRYGTVLSILESGAVSMSNERRFTSYHQDLLCESARILSGKAGSLLTVYAVLVV